MKPWNTVGEIADDVAAILKTERIDSAHIVGTSLGGMIALEFALKYPQLTKSLSIISSSVGRSGHMRLSIPAIKTLVTAPFKKEAIYTDLARLLTSPHTDAAIIKKLEHEWRSEDSKHKKPHFTVLGQLLAAMRFRKWEDLAKITAPTQIIVGHDDQFVPRGNSLFLHSKMPGSELKELEKAGHEPHIDQPEILTQLVKSFVKKHSK
jgi:pimeloyl-ACP methyl ester carboxylesterase